MNERGEALKREAQQIDHELAQATIPPAPDAAGSPGAPPGAVAGEAAAPPPPPVVTPEEEARGLIDVAISIVLPLYPSLQAIYTDEVKARLARGAGPVLAKYQVSIGGMFARWKEEIDFGMVFLPTALATVRAIKIEQAARAKDKPADPAAPPPAAGSPANEPLTGIGG